MLGILTNVGGIYVTSFYNLLTGQIRTSQDNLGTSFANRSASIVSVGNGWYRCSITVRTINSVTILNLFDLSNGVSNSYAGDGVSGLYIWGTQFEHGPVAKEYVPTTSAVIYGPRLDYDPRLSVKPAMLIEDARTNLCTYSQDINNATGWTDFGSPVVTPDIEIAPDGTLTADLITMATLGHAKNHAFISVSAAVAYASSIYIKANIGTQFAFALLYFDAGSSFLSQTTVTVNIADGINCGNGWFRHALLVTTPANTAFIQMRFSSVATANAFYLWGAQLEASPFATSYIPTITATVTRAADTLLMAVTAFPFSTTATTLYAKWAQMQSAFAVRHYLLTHDESGNDRLALRAGDLGPQSSMFVYGTGAAAISIVDATVFPAFSIVKAAGGVDGTGSAYYSQGVSRGVNAGIIATSAGGVLGIGCNEAGSNQLFGWLFEAAYMPRRLSNTELQAKTV
jgi:hypothetical protein